LWFCCCCIVDKSVCICESCWLICIVCCSRSVLLICICLWYKFTSSWCWRFNVCIRWLLSNDCFCCCCSWRVCRKTCSNKRYSLLGFANNELDVDWWHWQVHEGETKQEFRKTKYARMDYTFNFYNILISLWSRKNGRLLITFHGYFLHLYIICCINTFFIINMIDEEINNLINICWNRSFLINILYLFKTK
jgi:hypothetical protein